MGDEKEVLDYTEEYGLKSKSQVSSNEISVSSERAKGNEDMNEEGISPEERRKRLAKRLVDMIEKIEDLSNQIYHLQQRMEVVERKLGASRGENN